MKESEWRAADNVIKKRKADGKVESAILFQGSVKTKKKMERGRKRQRFETTLQRIERGLTMGMHCLADMLTE